MCREKVEDDLSIHSTKKVTFGSNVKSEEENFLKENNEEKVGEKREESESLSNSFTPTAVLSYPSNHRYQNCRDSDSELEDLELQVKELDETNIDDEEEEEYEGEEAIKEESSDSLFSLSIESRKPVSGAATDDKEINSPLSIESRKPVSGAGTTDDDKEINIPFSIESRKLVSCAATADDEEEINSSPMAKPVLAHESKPGESKGNNTSDWRRRQYVVDSVLNPIEGPQQWKKKKKIKARTAHQDKENIKQDVNMVSISMEAQSRKLNDEGIITVDASLSSWLVGLETSTVSVGNSPSDGAKSSRRLEEVEQLSAASVSSSPRTSRSRSQSRSPSPDEEEPIIIGTVGSYWKSYKAEHGHSLRLI